MTTVVMSSAFLLYATGVLVAFGLRTWLHYRRTGSSGFNGFSTQRGSLEWWAARMFTLAVLAALAAPALALSGVVPILAALASPWTGAAGLVLLVLGFVGTTAAQVSMGASWRIGVDEAERTELVTAGVFAWVRNPIFTAMATSQLGLALAAPSVLSLLALACLLIAVQVQVRRVEEPYLLRTHLLVYHSYAARTGRFLPRLGRLPTETIAHK
ncbi:methyltransferase family protein [Kineococcus arenarius]|uniref:methyltransferase family protein n=1 Tax=unclassified Kineococcus TaxID=2621656 RepID=UPI003D7CD444